MVLTAEQAFKISQKGAIREEKKSKKKICKRISFSNERNS